MIRLLILGSGFAAFRLLKAIDPHAYAVTVVSRRNHFLFTPLLPSTAVGTIEYRTIPEPLRRAAPRAHVRRASAGRPARGTPPSCTTRSPTTASAATPSWPRPSG